MKGGIGVADKPTPQNLRRFVDDCMARGDDLGTALDKAKKDPRFVGWKALAVQIKQLSHSHPGRKGRNISAQGRRLCRA